MIDLDVNIKNLPLMYDWLKSISQNIGLPPNFTIQPIVGDASVRTYYLLTPTSKIKSYNHEHHHPNKQLIIMQTPVDDSMKNFINIANYLSTLNLAIEVPKVLAQHNDAPIGYILLSYLGDQLLSKNLNLNNAKSIYKTAWQSLAQIQVTAKNPVLLSMNREYIKKNLLIFKTWYLETHLNLHNVNNLDILLDQLESYFVTIFTAQPQVFVHVDYHSRNLILDIAVENPVLGILDFQDAMQGPVTYDIVSLLQDAYLTWPEDLTEIILLEYFTHLQNHSNLISMDFNQFLRFFYLTGLQRHVKNLGIFARLNYLHKKPNYLQHIPNLLNYINKTCNKFLEPELIMLKNLLIN